MKILYTFVCVLVAMQWLFAFEPDMLNLQVPSVLDKTDLVVGVQHRFYGEITDEPLNTFFGTDEGANVGLGLRYAILPRAEVNASYTRVQKEYTLGASYAHYIPQILMNVQVGIHYFDHESFDSDERTRNFFYGLALQTEPLARIITPVVNVGYDGDNERIGLGLGIGIGFNLEIGPVERAHLLAEYYPVINRDVVNGPENYFAAGIKLDTYGHHFILLVGNGSAIGPRRLMLGTETNDLYLGLTIHRRVNL
jgi:hypothetical protein